jgi:hypothetical protein
VTTPTAHSDFRDDTSWYLEHVLPFPAPGEWRVTAGEPISFKRSRLGCPRRAEGQRLP